jgi:hypothetical protein
MIWFVVVIVSADIWIAHVSSINQNRKIKQWASLVCVKVRQIPSMYQHFMCRSMWRKPADNRTDRDVELLKLIIRNCDIVMWIGCNWQLQNCLQQMCGNHRFLWRVHKLRLEAHKTRQRRWQHWMLIRLARFC